MIIDGTDLSTVGLIVRTRGNSRGTAQIRDAFAEIPGANQARRLGRGPIGAKPITLEGIVEGSSLSDLRDNLDKVIWYLRPGTSHTLEWSDENTLTSPNLRREWVVYFSDVRIRGHFPEWQSITAPITVNVFAEDPRGRNPNEQTTSTSGALPLVLTPSDMGNAPMPVSIEVTGSSTNIEDLTIEYRDSSDTVVHTFSWDGTDLTASDTLIINTGTAVVERNGSNDVSSITDANGALPFDMDPGDGDFLTSSWPDIRLSGTGSSDNAVIRYRERYW